MSLERTERKGSQVVHVRDGSDQAFEELFKVVINPPEDPTKPSPVPLRMRNLPASFFQQPDSQKNIVDGDISGYPSPPNSVAGMAIAHSRAHSSPASLQQTLSAAPPLPPQHMRQHSYDLVTDDQPLPPGWDIAKTSIGQRYFLNHLSQTTTWQDPRKSVSTNNLNKQQQQQQQQQSGQPPQPPSSPSQSQQTIDSTPLPQGWERAYTAEGEVYYINHLSRTTSWFHPNIPAAHLQRPGMRLQQQMGNPRPSQPMSPSQRPMTPEEQQRQMKLHHLQREKERLKQRQDEIARQEMMIRANLAGNPEAQQQQQQIQSQTPKLVQANEMTSVTDPFLGQTGTSDLHSRQESADSGLGGMGTNYSLPRTPEDFLSMEDMDTQDGGPKLSGQGDFGSIDMTPMGSVDGSSDATNMDSDDLVPSLQEDISNDLLKDVETVLSSNKMDNLLTWL
ncbi:transcriptional coactivator YAP1-like isoform X1 [Haliotis rufescens]|uniref:transcriptional coactivator YAP1-like isoform X1 n=1 Tax=Haliotis rufescens TaxID=6454 RepID=UPI001EB0016E|nr:transcriptional coactivator YAP1-like isoform X1 [Haliotis rufescens]